MVCEAPLATYSACFSAVLTPSSTMNGIGQFHAIRSTKRCKSSCTPRSRSLSCLLSITTFLGRLSGDNALDLGVTIKSKPEPGRLEPRRELVDLFILDRV